MPNSIIREVKKFGIRSAHITVPNNWQGKQVEVKLIGQDQETKEINWPNITTLIKKIVEDEIEAAKRGY